MPEQCRLIGLVGYWLSLLLINDIRSGRALALDLGSLRVIGMSWLTQGILARPKGKSGAMYLRWKDSLWGTGLSGLASGS